MKTTFYINSSQLTVSDVDCVISNNLKIKLSKESVSQVVCCRSYLDKKLASDPNPIYGINTGFGSLCDIKISDSNLSQLQENLVKSHACGCGEIISNDIIKIMLLLKVKSLSLGYSGVHIDTINRLVDFYNNDVFPIIYEQGSLGASGDLAPLAHLALPLLGLGEVNFQGNIVSSLSILEKFNWKPIELKSKEGLALLNGTQFMSAYGVYNLIKAQQLIKISDCVGGLSLDAFDCRLEPFNSLIHKIRPHKGQIVTAQIICELLKGSSISKSAKIHVQDPYSFRCIPQVHGASRDAISYVTSVFETEINAVTDNPNIFEKEDVILSGGNFHGQPLALAIDFLKIAIAEIANISERRTFQLVSGKRDLPAFLIHNPGLNSGFMIPQYTAASIVSLNKQLCSPSSVDSIVSSNGQEDHVSMGANAAVLLSKVVDNSFSVLAIELLCAAQAIDLRKPQKTSKRLQLLLSNYRNDVNYLSEDQVMYDIIEKSKQFIQRFDFNKV
jgi:histidine ammonia-lyase